MQSVESRAGRRADEGMGSVDAGRLARAWFVVAGLTYGLIVLGALVRAHGAGLSCPDWPLCFGDVIPQLDFKVAFEFGHRVVAGSIALLFAGLAIATLRRPELAPAVRRPIAVAALLLALQIVLGGLTVLKLLATWTVTSLVVIGRRVAERAGLPGFEPTRRGTALERGVVAALAGLLALQIVLGGLVSSSYAGLVCPDWPTCMNGEFFPAWTGIQGLHVLHRTVAYTLLVALPVSAHLLRAHPKLGGWLRLASGLALCQVAAGVSNVLLRLPVELTALHSAFAAALVCTVGIGVQIAWRSRSA